MCLNESSVLSLSKFLFITVISLWRIVFRIDSFILVVLTLEIKQARGFASTPIEFFERTSASTKAVPQPQKGSNTHLACGAKFFMSVLGIKG